MAVDLVKGLTGDTAGVTKLSEQSQQLLPELLKLISDSDSSIQRSAITSLVNLCQVLSHSIRHQTVDDTLCTIVLS